MCSARGRRHREGNGAPTKPLTPAAARRSPAPRPPPSSKSTPLGCSNWRFPRLLHKKSIGFEARLPGPCPHEFLCKALALLADAFPDFPVGTAANHLRNRLVSPVSTPRPDVPLTRTACDGSLDVGPRVPKPTHSRSSNHPGFSPGQGKFCGTAHAPSRPPCESRMRRFCNSL